MRKIIEKDSLCIALTPGNFTDLKRVLEYLFRMLAIKMNFKELESSSLHFIEGRLAKIIINDKEAGVIGEIHPRILRNWKIKMPVALVELNLESVFENLK
jgi:phenylalanyl-tRNA synthetase beta chain